MEIVSVLTDILGPPIGPINHKGFLPFTCPSCAKSSSHFSVKITDDGGIDRGFYNCFRCGFQGGSVKRLLQDLGIDNEIKPVWSENIKLPEKFFYEQSVADPVFDWVLRQSKLSDADKQYLEQRGLDTDKLDWVTMPHYSILCGAFREFGEDTCRAIGLHKPFWFYMQGKIVIPCHYKEHTYLTFHDRGAKLTGGKKILRPLGSNVSGMLYPALKGSFFTSSVVITEGEIKAEASRQAGVPTIGLPGMHVAHGECASQIQRMQHIDKVIILLDEEEDLVVRGYVDRAAGSLLSHLHCKAPIVRAHLPRYAEGKSDIDGWLCFLEGSGKTREEAREVYRKFIKGI